METARVRHGMGIMHSDVMDTDFHSGDAWNSMPLNWMPRNPKFRLSSGPYFSYFSLLFLFAPTFS